MTLTEFSRDIVPLVQLIISLAGVAGVVLLWYQLRLDHLWNKTNTQHTLLSNLPTQELETFVWELFDSLEKDTNGAITKKSSEKIRADIKNWVKVKSFLNKFEHLCAAINVNAINEEYAYAVHSARITDIYFKFLHYIDYAREMAGDDEIYIEIQKVATRWHQKYISDKKMRDRQLRELKEKISNDKGVRRVVP